MPKIIPTAEEFLKNFNRQEGHTFEQSVPEAMIEFTKQHVEAALKAAKKDYVFNEQNESDDPTFLADIILNAYPLTNIK